MHKPLGYVSGDNVDERVLPHSLVNRVRLITHLARYEFADSVLPLEGPVLDLGCGTGYGTALVGRRREIIGVDRSADAIEYAVVRYTTPTVRFSVEDAVGLPFADSSMSSVVCFEVIEHVPNPEKLLHEVRRVLKPMGQLVISTPNADSSMWRDGCPVNPFHFTEYTAEQFGGLLEASGFTVGELMVQESGPATDKMRRAAMGLGERLMRGREAGYWPPLWEQALHHVFCPLLVGSSWKAVGREAAVRPSTGPGDPEFFVVVGNASDLSR
jgi:SAM-dependent methyltransferase